MKAIQKCTLLILSAALISSNISFSVYADDSQNRVRIVVENDTFSVSDGAVWEGTLIDEWVDNSENMSAADLFEKTLSEHGYTQSGAKDNYVTEINGLFAGADEAQMGGWMIGYDDWYGNGGINTLNLENGDEIAFSYSLNWGVDIGSDFMSVSTKLKSLDFDKGQLSPTFSNEITEYSLKLSDNTESVKITPVAENKNYRFKIYKNEYTPDNESSDFKRTENISVSDGDVVYIGVGHNNWHSYTPDGLTETVYKITVSGGNSDHSDADRSTNTDSSDTDMDVTDISVDSMISQIHSDLTPANNEYLPGDEWILFTDCRLGFCSGKEAVNYLNKLNDTIKSTPPKRATDYAKYILILTALGEDPTNWKGINMCDKLSDFDFASKQGINGIVYTLLAFDSKNYSIPKSESGIEQTTREKLISAILDAQLKDGGWAFFGDVFEPDMTGMAIQALAPYYNKNSDVTRSVDRALILLSEKQNNDGTYTSYGEPNCENSAQIIIALSALGIDADKDERFIKDGNSALDGLKSFWNNDSSSFSHTLNHEKNVLSTVQSYEALCAYKLFLDNQEPFYSLRNVVPAKDTETDQTSGSDEPVSSTANNLSYSAAISDTSPVDTGDNYSDMILILFSISLLSCVLIKNFCRKAEIVG